MQNQNPHRTDIEKLAVLLPYWVNHTHGHIRDQEKWFKKAQKEGLIEVADELKRAIEHSKRASRHMKQAHLCLKDKKAVNRAEILNTGPSQIASKKETFPPDSIDFNLKQIGVIRTSYTVNAPYQPLANDDGDFRIVVNPQYSDGLRDLHRFHFMLLDLKPYIKELDFKADANYGWLEDLDDRDHLMLHIKGIPHDS